MNFYKTAVVAFFLLSAAVANQSVNDSSQAVEFKIRLVSKKSEISFDQTKLSAPFGKKIVLTYSNEAELNSEISHDVALIKLGMEKKVTDQLIKNNYDLSKVDADNFIVKTKVLKPGESETITFQPSAPGNYSYICLMPGHLTMMGMKGVLTVEKNK